MRTWAVPSMGVNAHTHLLPTTCTHMHSGTRMHTPHTPVQAHALRCTDARTCANTRMHSGTQTCTHPCKYMPSGTQIHPCANTYPRALGHTDAHAHTTCVSTCTHTDAHMHTPVLTHTCMYSDTHTATHRPMQACGCTPGPSSTPGLATRALGLHRTPGTGHHRAEHDPRLQAKAPPCGRLPPCHSAACP